ncbi:hypothetical protein [Actinoplanes sp. RD1]|uniref:hypothetical protein n=1 Tax=Actinoplanes sp. RD1 TaxID=3064538 RepID=UPI0027426A8F|nr:hypothetical protein [Actinoplanes sp. RD1]
MNNQKTPAALARRAATDEDYRRLGLRRSTVEPWEDGARTDNAPNTYEWWYFDAHLDGGGKLVVIWMNKLLAEQDKPLEPWFRFDLELPDGRKFSTLEKFPADSWAASPDGLDVGIAGNTLRGDLDELRISAASAGATVEVTMTPKVRAWRPETGHFYFGGGRDKLFAWLPAMPIGQVEVTYSVDGESTTVSGVGYHDHQWGNEPLPAIINDWYWGRGEAGPYSVIAFFITAAASYGYGTLPIFFLARHDEIVAADADKVRFETENVYTDEYTGKPVAGTHRYRYTDGDDEYIVEFVRDRDITQRRMIDDLTPERRKRAEDEGFNGAYIRFTGTLTIEKLHAGETVESFSEPSAIWELMYFGAPHAG